MKQFLQLIRPFREMRKIVVLCLAMVMSMGAAWGQTEEVYSTCRFGSAYNPNNTSYTSSFTVTNSSFTWTVTNANNNNNGWTNSDGYGQIKFGRKNNASVGKITTDAAYSEAITKVNLTIDAFTSGKINSIKLYTSSDNSAWTEVDSFTIATGIQTVSLSDPTTNLYYKIEFDCASGTSNGLITVSKVEYYYENSGPSAITTTTTIDATGITNTDVYVNTTAGSLSATVTPEGGSALANPAITWSSSNTGVATIDASGVVTLVSAGTTTITASYSGEENQYASSSATYELTVTSSEPYEQPTTIEANLNNSLFGTSYNGSVSNLTDANPVIGTIDNVTITYAGSGNHYINDSQIRFYPNNKLTFDAPSGYEITEIVFTSAGTWAATISANTGTYTSGTKTWAGSASSVLFTGSGSSRCDMSKATITIVPLGNAVATTTTIDATGITNTDVYTGTDAGSLSATVTVSEGGAAVPDASVTWSGNNDEVATIDATTGAVTLVGAGSVTFTASYAGVEDEYLASSGTYEMTVTNNDPNGPGTVNNPYTVTQARAAIDANTGTQGVYAAGIVSEIVTAYNTQYGNISFNFIDEGNTTDVLEAYRCGSGTGVDASEVAVGDTVVVYGDLIKYGSTYEFGQGCQLVSLIHPLTDVEAPTFSPVAGTYAEAQDVTISCATTGANIYYTIDGTEPTSESTAYTSAITVSSTTTIKAIAYVGNEASTVATATYHFCSADNPYTVTQALNFTEYPANGIYVSGIVSTAPTQLPTDNGELTYYISADGTATNQLEVYKGKGLNEAVFTAQDDIQVGDIVTVYGNVQVYHNTIEFGSGNYLVSFERPAVPSVTVTPATIDAPADGADGTLALTYENITDFISFDYYFCDAEGNQLDVDPDWIYAEINEEDDTYTLDYVIDANDGAARTAYIKVFTYDDDLEEVSAIVTVSQAAASVVPSGGNYVRITSLDQLTDGSIVVIAARYDEDHTNGYYAMPSVTSGKPNGVAFISETSGDNEILPEDITTSEDTYYWVVNVTNDDYTFTNAENYLIGYTSSTNFATGGNNTAWTITRETAIEQTMVANYTGFVIRNGNTNTRAFAFNGQAFGAYATSNMTTSGQPAGYNFYLDFFVQSDETPGSSITVNPDMVDENATEHEGTLALTYENLEISDMEDFGIQYYDAEGEEIDEPDWVEVTVAAQDPQIGEGYVVSYYMINNEGDARTAYFKVFALGNEDYVYSNLVTVAQAAPIAVTVTITGNTNTVDYDGEEHSVSGYTVTAIEIDGAATDLYTEADFTFDSTAAAARTDAGTTYMGLTSNLFTNTNANFSVTFDVTDGYVTIGKAAMAVVVTGNTSTVTYDGESHTVEGYSLSSESELYSESLVSYSGETAVTGTASGTYEMGLDANLFSYGDTNIVVTFTVASDGSLTISKAAMTVTVTGATSTVFYDGESHTVMGYTLSCDNTLYDPTKVIFSGEAEVTGTVEGTYPMGLEESQFSYSDTNIIVAFDITDGYLIITDCYKILVDAQHPEWVEDFENYNITTTERWTGVTPDCWTVPVQYTGTTDTLPQVYRGFNTTDDGQYTLRMHFRYLLAMPELDENVDLGKVRLNLNVRQPYYKYKLQIGVITDMDNPETSFVPVAVVNNNGKDMTNFECSFASVSGLVGAGRHIAFKNIGGSSNDLYCTNYLDDITLTYVDVDDLECEISSDYIEDFEAYEVGTEPDCWEVITEDVVLESTTRPQVYAGFNTTPSGSKSLRLKNRCVYAMPEFSDDYPINNFTMTFNLRQPKSIYRLQVGLVNEQGDFTALKTFKCNGTSLQEMELNFAGYDCTVGNRIAFRNTLVPGTGKRTDYLDYSINYIDDINLSYNARGRNESNANAFDAEGSLEDIAVYPNPTTGNLYIDAIGVQKVECYNQMGQLVRVYDNVSNSIDLNNLSDGVYTLRITVPQGVTVRKVVKR